FTYGNDIVNRKKYFDKGVSFSIPFDFFMNKSFKSKISFKLSEWLRDVGQKAETGKELFEIVDEERYFP
ncbi:MAG: YjbH domain-containing protein, partial [Parachlamydiales bacterium]|nr:YjbH domain-containing protein [Parachlamydiales bacterium]